MNLVLEFLKNRYVQLFLALGVGIFAGYSIYPTKQITETTEREITRKLTEEHQKQLKEVTERSSRQVEDVSEELKETKQKTEELNRHVETLVTENRSLRESKKTQKIKLIKPDGTVFEKEVEESNKEEVTSIVTQVKEEFTKKVASIEEKWKNAFAKRLNQINEQHKKELEEVASKREVVVEKEIVEKKVVVNPKYFGVDASVFSDLEFGVGVQYDFLQPFYLTSEYMFDKDSVFNRVGVGVGIKF